MGIPQAIDPEDYDLIVPPPLNPALAAAAAAHAAAAHARKKKTPTSTTLSSSAAGPSSTGTTGSVGSTCAPRLRLSKPKLGFTPVNKVPQEQEVEADDPYQVAEEEAAAAYVARREAVLAGRVPRPAILESAASAVAAVPVVPSAPASSPALPGSSAGPRGCRRLVEESDTDDPPFALYEAAAYAFAGPSRPQRFRPPPSAPAPTRPAAELSTPQRSSSLPPLPPSSTPPRPAAAAATALHPAPATPQRSSPLAPSPRPASASVTGSAVNKRPRPASTGLLASKRVRLDRTPPRTASRLPTPEKDEPLFVPETAGENELEEEAGYESWEGFDDE